MMYTLKFTSAYKKSYKLMIKRGLDTSLLDEKYRDHELTGNIKGFRECHVKPDWLLIYLVENDILTLTLVDTGSHSDLFMKPTTHRLKGGVSLVSSASNSTCSEWGN